MGQAGLEGRESQDQAPTSLQAAGVTCIACQRNNVNNFKQKLKNPVTILTTWFCGYSLFVTTLQHKLAR